MLAAWKIVYFKGETFEAVVFMFGPSIGDNRYRAHALTLDYLSWKKFMK